MNFEIDTSDYLGFKFEKYLNQVQALAMSEPSKYYALRSKVLEALKEVAVKQVYDSYYGLLTTGEFKNNGDTFSMGYVPSYPAQKASAFSLSAAKTINDILDKCLDIILPESHLDVAKLRLTKKAEGELVDK